MGLGRLLNKYLLAPFGVRLVRTSQLRTLQAARNRTSAAGEKVRKLTKRLQRCEHKRARGVGNDASWDVAVAERGIPTYQFDHTIEGGPTSHRHLHFFRDRIVGTPEEDGVTIGAVLDRHGDDRDAVNILKIDIEGAEWPVFANAGSRQLRRFSQIVCEFHRFHRAGDAAWYEQAKRAMETLAADFEVVHVHANNASPFVLIGDLYFPQTLEVTLANRARYQFTPCSDTFPTTLDQGNIPGIPDFYLGRFQF